MNQTEVTPRLQSASNHKPAPAYRLLRSDLCAQLAPLNLYGLMGLSAVIVGSLIALTRLGTSMLGNSEEAAQPLPDSRSTPAINAGSQGR
jgi:hypothetical protein